jgi:superfamily I DNA/RNA helicase
MAAITCPKCAAPMILRTKKGTSFQFYGCSTFPKCNGYLPYVEIVKPHNTRPTTNVIGSAEQNRIWECIKTGTQHLIVEAVAGSGKTFTIVHALHFLTGKKVAFAAFNKHIATELQERVPAGVSAFTLHSFGFSQVRKALGSVSLDEYKVDIIIDSLITNKEDESIKSVIKHLVDLCRYNMFSGTEQEIDQLVTHHGIETNGSWSLITTIVPQIIKICKNNKKVVDFTDMLWFIYAHDLAVETFDVFIGDEIQDWNPLQQYIAMKAIGDNGRFIGVGDRYQSIYGFAGADINSIPNMIARLQNTTRGLDILPLNMTRRLPLSHVDLAKQFVSHLEAMPNANVGVVEELDISTALDRMNIGDMVICRRNAPLINMAYALIRLNRPVVVKGRNFGAGLIALIKKLRGKDIPNLIEKAEVYRTKETERLNAKGKKAEQQIINLNDKIDTLIALTEDMDSIANVINRISTLFSDNSPRNVITLSSFHRAKGLEADNIFILDRARMMIPVKQDWAIQQERNAAYVAMTRGKKSLYFVSLPGNNS